MTLPEIEIRQPGENHFEEKASRFLDDLRRGKSISHVGLVGSVDDSKYSQVELYALSRERLRLEEDKKQAKQIQTLLNSFNNFAYSIRPDVFIYLHLLDAAKYSPSALEETLKAKCRKERKRFIGFEAVS